MEKKINKLEGKIKKVERKNIILQEKVDSFNERKKAKWNFRFWLSKKAVNIFIGKGLRNSMLTLYQELPSDVSKETLADVSSHIIWRITRIGLFAFTIALIPGLILIAQTYLLNKQNNIGIQQNDIVLQQMFIAQQQLDIEKVAKNNIALTAVFDKIEKDFSMPLSNPIKGRIISLSRKLTPYRYLEGDSLIQEPLSPERGELLLYLIGANLDSISYKQIFNNSDFSYSSLSQSYLRYANMYGINLNNTNLSFAYLSKADLSFANLNNANLRNAYLSGTILRGADLTNANLSNTILYDADLYRADLRHADLSAADLRRAILFGADLSFANLSFANLESISLDSVKVHRYDWLVYIRDDLKLIGAEKIYNDYRIDSVYYNKGDKEKAPMIIRKEINQ